jgi:hypothetical protein
VPGLVAAAAGTAVVNSASNEEGLVNQAFKITILIALALAVGVGLFLVWKLTSVFAGLVASIAPLFNLVTDTGGILGAVGTTFLSASLGGFGRGFRALRF